MSGKYSIVRLSVEGNRFEILVNPDTALSFKQGKNIDISKILINDTIFSNASKGLRASEEKLYLAFHNADSYKIAQKILKKGQLQITTDQRKKMIVEKKKQIISYISRHSVDPRTGFPHPPLRIEQALNQIRVKIDPFRKTEEQVKLIINELRSILPIGKGNISIAVKIPPEYVSQSIGIIKSFGLIKKQEWQKNGSLIAIVEIPAGMHSPFLEKLQGLVHGNLQVKILQ
jgi:ribosome maturation protein SDO1